LAWRRSKTTTADRAGQANSLAGQTNAEVAAFYTSLYKRTASIDGPPKLDAQVLATAIAVYVTNQTLAGTTAAAYGFQVTTGGLGAATFDVGESNRAAFGLSPTASTLMTVLDILLAAEEQDLLKSSSGLTITRLTQRFQDLRGCVLIEELH
jgi:hypothetical protein